MFFPCASLSLRTCVFTLQEIEKICWTLQSHVLLVWTIRLYIDKAEQLPVLRSRLKIEVRPTENDLTQLYKNGDISVVITCS